MVASGCCLLCVPTENKTFTTQENTSLMDLIGRIFLRTSPNAKRSIWLRGIQPDQEAHFHVQMLLIVNVAGRYCGTFFRTVTALHGAIHGACCLYGLCSLVSFFLLIFFLLIFFCSFFFEYYCCCLTFCKIAFLAMGSIYPLFLQEMYSKDICKRYPMPRLLDFSFATLLGYNLYDIG